MDPGEAGLGDGVSTPSALTPVIHWRKTLHGGLSARLGKPLDVKTLVPRCKDDNLHRKTRKEAVSYRASMIS